TTAYVQSQLLSPADLPATDWSLATDYPIPGMLAPVEGKTFDLSGLLPLADNSPVGVSGKRVRIASTIALDGTNGGFTPAGATGALRASIGQPFLVDAFPPPVDPSTGNLLWSVLATTGQAGTFSVPSSAFNLQPSIAADPVAGESALVAKATVEGSTTNLALVSALERIYDAPTVAVNANAVIATHGETVQEILGSGDATNAALTFQLKQSPLTYTSAATASGAQSTLQVRVNNLLWSEVDNFLDSAARDRAFLTRPNSGAGPTIQFGNGIQGSRTPTGQSNIRAQYRRGIGLAGMVASGQLTQPIDRPQGLQAVTNPGPATGGADPATPDQARQSAPLPTLTLGRIVSLEDYQNFALGFAGISLALATWTWFGNTRGIFLTLAGAGGSTLDASDSVVQNLLLAYQDLGLPHVQVAAASYVPVLFEIGLQVQVDVPTWDPDQVVAQVWQDLSTAFSFGPMRPAQGVAASEVVRIAQQVPGVVAVDLTSLGRSGGGGGTATLLCAAGPQPTADPPVGAEVLLLDPASRGNVGVWS
ncbi:MAG TPA: putative baseplate assembly protein, partial [Fibrobacteria bacterium]|nr:putative baseplate assembly protein [Fibrobacteria bacterium]